MGFYDEAVNVLETIAKALSGAFSYGAMCKRDSQNADF